MTRLRPTVRWRLSLLFGMFFLVLGLILLVASWSLFRAAIVRQPDITIAELIERNPDLSGMDGLDTELGRARREERSAIIRDAGRSSILVLSILSVLAAGTGWIAAGRMLSPLRRVLDHVRLASPAIESNPMHLEGPDDEFRELADAYDLMLGRVNAAFASQRRFSGDVSHELRTPLAVIRAEAELLASASDATERERNAGQAILVVTERSERLIGGLLALSRAEFGAFERIPVDLATMTGDVVAELAPFAGRRRLDVDLALDDAVILTDPGLIRQLVANLVQNAIVHNVDGGWIRVQVGLEQGAAVLRIANGGYPVGGNPTDLVAPFRRGEASGGGAGLGLAIVRQVVQVVGGTLLVSPRDGGGLTVDVRIPAAGESVTGPQAA